MRAPEFITRGPLVSPSRRTGEAGPPGLGFYSQTARESSAGRLRAAPNSWKRRSFGLSCGPCPASPTAISPHPGNQCYEVDSVGDEAEGLWGGGWAPGHTWGRVRGCSPGIPTPELENEAACSSVTVKRAPQGPGLQAGAESWLQFELMLLRRSRWVPPGSFGRLQIAFKLIHPGGRRAVNALNQPSELRKPGKQSGPDLVRGLGVISSPE